jgi:hypothetical protein
MTGEQFVRILEKEFSIRIGAATRSQWRKKSNVSLTIFRNALKKMHTQALERAIFPITEYHYLSREHGKKSDYFANRLNNKKLESDLKVQVGGIYAFFDSTGELVYVGKTPNNLFTEIQQRFNGKRISFRTLSRKGKPRWNDWTIRDVADFISAYGVDKAFVANVEALLTRLIINITSNIRVDNFISSTTSAISSR